MIKQIFVNQPQKSYHAASFNFIKNYILNISEKLDENKYFKNTLRNTRQKKTRNSLSLYSLQDLAANKLFTISHRGVYRDYIDLFFLLKEKFSLKTLVDDCKEKFKDDFNERLVLEQLVYFEDIQDWEIDFLKKTYKPEEVKKLLILKVKEYRNQYIDRFK